MVWLRSPQYRTTIMLILTRRVAKKLMLGQQVSLTVLSLHGLQVRFGVAAAKTVPATAKKSSSASGANATRSPPPPLTTKTNPIGSPKPRQDPLEPSDPQDGP
jgi:hypothetical protein